MQCNFLEFEFTKCFNLAITTRWTLGWFAFAWNPNLQKLAIIHKCQFEQSIPSGLRLAGWEKPRGVSQPEGISLKGSMDVNPNVCKFAL